MRVCGVSSSFDFLIVNVGMPKLLSALAVQVDESVEKIWNARTDIEEVDQFIIEIKVQNVGHVILLFSTGANELLI